MDYNAKMCEVYETLLSAVSTEIAKGVERINTKELSEVMDMLKDIKMAIYYDTVTESMKKESESGYETAMKTSEVLRDMDKQTKGKMYFTEPFASGKSAKSRRTYMETKEVHGKEHEDMHDLESYMMDLTDDVMEMIRNMTPTEKTLLKQKMQVLIQKIN